MNKLPHQYASKIRKDHHLKLNDLSYLLQIDQANLSRFETEKISSPKALVGYHILLNLSIESSIRQVFEEGFKGLSDRCFQLIETIQRGPQTLKNKLRIEGLNTIVSRLMSFEQMYV